MVRWSILLALVAAAALPAAAQPVVRVAAASDLRFVLEDVARELEKRTPAVRIEATYGSSGNLHAQLQQRAPYDLYLSADIAYPEDLVKRGIGNAEDLFTYAVGRLTLWVPNGSTLPIEQDGLRALVSVRRLAIANPAHAPYGRAAEAALRRAGVWHDLQPRLVLGENIAQAAQFVDSGAADAGLIAKSLAAAPAMRGRGRGWDLPSDSYPPLQQGGLILRAARARAGAVAVRDFLRSAEGRDLLARSGFGLPPR
jgi:molybdate transport system substrate-binding protein